MKVIYIGKRVFQSFLIEWIGKQLKMIYFDHGWNFRWSIMIYLKMYTFSLLMLRKPLLTWILSFLSTICFLLIFNVPITIQQKMRSFLKESLRFFTLKRSFFLALMIAIIAIIGIAKARKFMQKNYILVWLFFTVVRMLSLSSDTKKMA
ncbi:hypothetical protein [Salinibacillus kushneri]|nr:hypothetical protein [Salinibacillus kushneri]